MGFLIFVFIKFAGRKRYRLYGLKIVSFPVPLLCLHTLVMASLQLHLDNLIFLLFLHVPEPRQRIPNQTLWMERVPVYRINRSTSGIQLLYSIISQQAKQHRDIGNLACFRPAGFRKTIRRQSHTRPSIAPTYSLFLNIPGPPLCTHSNNRQCTSHNNHHLYTLCTWTHVLPNQAGKICLGKSIYSSWVTKSSPQHWVSNQKLPV